MVEIRQAGQTRRKLRWASLLTAGSFSFALTLAAGCSGTQHAQAPPVDPLFGARNPPGMQLPTDMQKVSAAPPTQPQAFGPGGVPALPASMSSSNPATLAGTSWKGPLGQPTPLDGNSYGPPLLPGRATLGSQTPQVIAPPPNANPKVEQVPDVPTTTPPVTPTASWQPTIPATGSQRTRSEVLLKELQDRGVVNQKQDAVPEGIHLTCYVSRGPSGGLRILEATAADYTAAAEAILRQLDATR